MIHNIVALIVGLLFGAGLIVSGMTEPNKVIGFLDVFGNWDPSLMFVMIGAIGVHFFAYRFIVKKPHPVFSKKFHIPTRKDIDFNLVVGSVIFGIGWGMAGLCPGPALTSILSGSSLAIYFGISFLVGLSLFKIYELKLSKK